MSDLPTDYRTREDEEREVEERKQNKKVRFQDISTTAAWIAAGYQAFTPEQIRQNIQKEWINKVTGEVSRDPKFRTLFEPRQRGEPPEDYNRRRVIQTQTKQAVNDLVGAYGDSLYSNSPETRSQIQETLSDLIDNDYQHLKGHETELLQAVAKSQENSAEQFKKINDKNNNRFNEKGIYRRTPEQLQNLQNQEQVNFHSEVISRRVNKEDLATTDKKEQERLNIENQVTEHALSNVLAQDNAKNLTEEEFTNLFRIEINKQLYNKRGKKRYKIDGVDEVKIARISGYYKSYFNKTQPVQQIPQEQNETRNAPQTSTTRIKIPQSIQPTKNFFNRFNWADLKIKFGSFRIDFSGLNSLFKSNLSGMARSLSQGLGNFGGFLSKLPGIGGFFGGGTAVGGAAVGASATAGGAAAGAAATGAAAAGGGLLATVGAPLLIVGAIVLLVGLVFMLGFFNNPSVQPQAIIESLSPTPVI